MRRIKLMTALAALLFLTSCFGREQQSSISAGDVDATCNAIEAQVEAAAAAITAADAVGGDPCTILNQYNSLAALISANQNDVSATQLEYIAGDLALRRLSAIITLALSIDPDELKNGGSDQSICDVFSSVVCPGITQEAFKNMLFDLILDILRSDRQMLTSSTNDFFKFNLKKLIFGGMGSRKTLDPDCFNLMYDWLIQAITNMKSDVTCQMTVADVNQYIKDNIIAGYRDQKDECPLSISTVTSTFTTHPTSSTITDTTSSTPTSSTWTSTSSTWTSTSTSTSTSTTAPYSGSPTFTNQSSGWDTNANSGYIIFSITSYALAGSTVSWTFYNGYNCPASWWESGTYTTIGSPHTSGSLLLNGLSAGQWSYNASDPNGLSQCVNINISQSGGSTSTSTSTSTTTTTTTAAGNTNDLIVFTPMSASPTDPTFSQIPASVRLDAHNPTGIGYDYNAFIFYSLTGPVPGWALCIGGALLC